MKNKFGKGGTIKTYDDIPGTTHDLAPEEQDEEDDDTDDEDTSCVCGCECPECDCDSKSSGCKLCGC